MLTDARRDTLRQILTISALVATLVVNGLANALPINGLTTGEISDRFDVYFVPAGYVFSIWALIYLALAGYVVYQALPAQKDNPLLRRIAPWFILGALFNLGWILFWHYEQFAWTLPLMVGLLLTLIVIYVQLGVGRYRVSPAERWLVRFPFSLYLGWITVATVANVTSLLAFWQWDGWGLAPDLWAVIMLVVASLVAGTLSIRHRDVVYVGVIVWAYIGIAVKHSDTLTVAGAALLFAVLVVLTLFITPAERGSDRIDARRGVLRPR